MCADEQNIYMTTLPEAAHIINNSSRHAILRQWEQGLVSLSCEDLDWVAFGIDTSRDWGMPCSELPEGFNPDDFDGFECS